MSFLVNESFRFFLGRIGEIACVYVIGRNIWLRLCAIEKRFVVCVWEFEVGVVGGVIEQRLVMCVWEFAHSPLRPIEQDR